MPFPITDWQFWLVTLIALVAAWFVLREVAPPGMMDRVLGRKKRGQRRASLTIEGKRAETKRTP